MDPKTYQQLLAQQALSKPSAFLLDPKYLENNGLGAYTSNQAQKDISSYLNNPFRITPTVSGSDTSKEPSWTTDGVLNKIGGYFGTNGDTLKSIGSGLGDLAGFGNTLFGMYNKNQATKLAKDNYNFQKNLAIKQMHQADADRARFLSNQKAATKSYYGK